MYLSRVDADAQYGGEEGHIYQGDLFQSLSFMLPRPDGSWDDKQWDAIVISHDCEYTKIAASPTKPLLIAPVRSLSDYSQRESILAGEAYSLWALPNAAPVDDDEYVADFRLIQPIAVGMLQGAHHWACLAAESREELQAMLGRFLFRGVLEGGA